MYEMNAGKRTQWGMTATITHLGHLPGNMLVEIGGADDDAALTDSSVEIAVHCYRLKSIRVFSCCVCVVTVK